LDNEKFEDHAEGEVMDWENITMEEEEKMKATESPLSKVCSPSAVMSPYCSHNCNSCTLLQTRSYPLHSSGKIFTGVQLQSIPILGTGTVGGSP